MAESTLTKNRWTGTRKAAVVLGLLCSGEAAEVARRHGLSQARILMKVIIESGAMGL